MKFRSSALLGQPPVAALSRPTITGDNRADTGACPYGGKYDPAVHHRRSIRLQGYDYSKEGAYFVTLCTQDRECLFGDIVDGEMRLNNAGKMIQAVWDEIPANYPGIDIDAFIVMPNHIHGIVVIVGATPCGCPIGPCGCPIGPRGCPIGPRGCPIGPRGCPIGPRGCPIGPRACPSCESAKPGQPQGVAPTRLSLPDVVHRFKTMTTKRYADGVKRNGWSTFPGKLWQRNYWEHIVRNEPELNRIREYIHNNPAQWELDKLFVGAAPRGRPDDGNGQAQGPARTEIREPITGYGVEAWMA